MRKSDSLSSSLLALADIFLDSFSGNKNRISLGFLCSKTLNSFLLHKQGLREMKIQCDVCEKSPATVICCADEAALCAECDVQVHAANKLASKHQRLLLQCLSHNLHPCDICQEKAAFIFCVEDRALMCKDCDAPLHSANTLAANHQRYLATGIRVALSSTCDKDTSKPQMELRPPGSNSHIKTHSSCTTSTSWAVDDLLHFSDHESPHKKQQLEFGELEWLTDMNLFSSAAAEVPELPVSQPSNINAHRPSKLHTAHNKPRIESPDDEDENYTVPDLG